MCACRGRGRGRGEREWERSQCVSSKPTCKARRKLLRHFQSPPCPNTSWNVSMSLSACVCVCVCIVTFTLQQRGFFLVFFFFSASFSLCFTLFDAACKSERICKIFKHENGLANPQELSGVSETAQRRWSRPKRCREREAAWKRERGGRERERQPADSWTCW